MPDSFRQRSQHHFSHAAAKPTLQMKKDSDTVRRVGSIDHKSIMALRFSVVLLSWFANAAACSCSSLQRLSVTAPVGWSGCHLKNPEKLNFLVLRGGGLADEEEGFELDHAFIEEKEGGADGGVKEGGEGEANGVKKAEKEEEDDAVSEGGKEEEEDDVTAALEAAIRETEAALTEQGLDSKEHENGNEGEGKDDTEEGKAGRRRETGDEDGMEEEDEDLWSLEGRLLSLVRKLDAEKEKLEAEIQAVAHRLEILGAPAHVKGKFDETHTPLCDAEGFPRADLSIQEILESRFKLEELKTRLRSPMRLRTCSAMSGTDMVCGAVRLTTKKLDETMAEYFTEAARNDENN